VLAYAAGGGELFTGKPSRIVRGQEHSDRSYIADDTGTSEGGLRDEVFLQVRADDASAVRTFRLDHAGVDGVYPDLPRPQFPCENTRNGIESWAIASQLKYCNTRRRPARPIASLRSSSRSRRSRACASFHDVVFLH
jgi:hypothetical protein